MRKFIVTRVETTVKAFVVVAADKGDAHNRVGLALAGHGDASRIHGGSVAPSGEQHATSEFAFEVRRPHTSGGES